MRSFLEFIVEDHPAPLKAVATKQLTKLTPPEIRLIKDYVSGSDNINDFLRKPKEYEREYKIDRKYGFEKPHPKVMEGGLKVFKDAIRKHKLPVRTVCYRGTRKRPKQFNGKDIDKLQPGDIYSPVGFLSTSTDIDVASGEFDGGMILVITVPAGFRAMPVHRKLAKEYADEDELLFAPGAKFKVNRVEKRPFSNWRVMLTCVSDGL